MTIEGKKCNQCDDLGFFEFAGEIYECWHLGVNNDRG